MAKINLQIHFKEPTGEHFKKIISYINPNCDNVTLKNFVDSLNSLTSNQVEEVFKIVEKFLSETATDFVTVEDLQNIIAGLFNQIPDNNPITQSDLQEILEGNYLPVADEESLTAGDFIF